MKKTIKALALSAALISISAGALVSCGGDGKQKVGLICLHGETSTYDKNFIDAFKAACKAKGLKGIIKTDIPEGEEAYNTAKDLVDQGCKYVFADSFGHESHILRAAQESPEVQFSHATGTMAHTANVANFHNAFASIYEGRYLAGVAAGLKLKEMGTTNHNIGYVGAFPYAEVKSGYTSFYLGVKSIISDVTMDVVFTGSWYDEAGEKSAAINLIDNYNVALVSQHADSMGAPTACEQKNIPNVSYNGSTENECPNTFVVSSKINWQPYFEYCFDQIAESKAIDTDWSGKLGSTLYDGSVALTTLGKAAAAGTEAKLNEVAAKLRDGSLKVFDCSTFTVTNKETGKSEHLTSYKADVNTDSKFTPDTEVIKTEGGVTYFAESEYRSAPYFDIDIDGITVRTEKK